MGFWKWMKLLVFLLVFLLVGGFFLFSLLDYQPKDVEEMPLLGSGGQGFPTTFSLLSWNVEFGGYDQAVEQNWPVILALLEGTPADLVLLQEIDRGSKRVSGQDQVQQVVDSLANPCWTYALNYRSPWVPVPLANPVGRVESGLLTLSAFCPERAWRFRLPDWNTWPVKMFQYDRCLSVWEISVGSQGKKLFVGNLQLSPFFHTSLLDDQLVAMKELMMNWYAEGNYVVLGGDWQVRLPGVFFGDGSVQKIPNAWTPFGWKWAYDPSSPGENGGESSTTTDGFLLSPNVELLEAKWLTPPSTPSQHSPLLLSLALKANKQSP